MGRRRQGSLLIVCLVASLTLAICRQAARTAPAGGALSRLAPPGTATARGGAAQAEQQVTILGPWSGPTLESFWAVLAPFQQRSRVTVSFESTPDVARILAGRLEEGAGPDIAILPSAALAQEYARAGRLVPLRQALDVDRLAARYPAGWLDLASVDGEPYGLPYGVGNRSLVWYSPAEFQRCGWTVPVTWSELVALGERIASSGRAPWSLGLKGRAIDGDAGTDWVENILLRTAGPAVYDRWVRHEIAWTDPAIVEAFQRWSQVVGRPRQLLGGSEGAAAAAAAQAALELYQELPGAYLCLADSSALTLIAQRFPKQAAANAVDFFSLPPMSLGADVPVVVGGDVIVLLHKTPQAVALLAYLASGEAESAWVARGGFIAADAGIGLARYPEALTRRAAQEIDQSRVVRFDGSAQMPPEVARAFCRAVCRFVANPGQLDEILAEVETVAQEAYPRRGERGQE